MLHYHFAAQMDHYPNIANTNCSFMKSTIVYIALRHSLEIFPFQIGILLQQKERGSFCSKTIFLAIGQLSSFAISKSRFKLVSNRSLHNVYCIQRQGNRQQRVGPVHKSTVHSFSNLSMKCMQNKGSIFQYVIHFAAILESSSNVNSKIQNFMQNQQFRLGFFVTLCSKYVPLLSD